jgi:hypothetical protein
VDRLPRLEGADREHAPPLPALQLAGARAGQARVDRLRGVAVGFVDDDLVEAFDLGMLTADEEQLQRRLAKAAEDLRAGRRSAIQ